MNESKVLGKFARLYVSKITKFGVMLRSFEEKDLDKTGGQWEMGLES